MIARRISPHVPVARHALTELPVDAHANMLGWGEYFAFDFKTFRCEFVEYFGFAECNSCQLDHTYSEDIFTRVLRDDEKNDLYLAATPMGYMNLGR